MLGEVTASVVDDWYSRGSVRTSAAPDEDAERRSARSATSVAV